MSKHVRKILPLLLCLLLMACLLPAAYAADGNVEVTTLDELKTALANNTAKIYVYQDITLDASLTIPESCYVKVRQGSTFTVPQNMTLTINGKIEASFNGVIDVVGTLQNNGQIEMFDGGVVDVKGTYSHADGKAIVFNRNGNPDAAMPKFIVEQGAVCTLNLFRTQEGLVAADVLEGINPNAYSCHSNYDRENHVVKDTRVYYPSSRVGLGGMAQRGLAYIEVHGLDTYTLSEDVEIPVFENTPAKVDMSETTLVVPSGITLTVNGELTVKELQIENGGTVDVKGTLDAGRPVDLGRSGQPQGVLPQLIIENGATFTPGSFHIYNNVNAAEAVQGVDLSQYSYHKNYDRNNRVIRDDRVYYPSSRAGIEDMSNRALGYIEIRGLDTYTLSTDVEIPVFDTTPATVDMAETTLVVPSGRTLAVNGELKVNALVIQPGGSVTLAAGGKLTTSAQSADLTLPAALTTIESEAFSGGAFTSVYIPASVTSIASDAFGTRTDLTIYGTIGSQAQTFARNRFTFVALAPAA